MEVRDEQLLADYLRGDEAALELLFARYLKPIYYLAYRYTGACDEAEDLAQETFVRVWRHRKKFKKYGNFRAWIFTIAKNAALDWCKKKKTMPFSALSASLDADPDWNYFAEFITDQEPRPEDVYQQHELTTDLNQAAAQLPPEQQQVLEAHHGRELSFKEIARELKLSLNTVKSRYWRALRRLKELLE